MREPLTAEEFDRLSNACKTPGERLVVWTLPDTRLRVSELCGLTSKNVLWQQRQVRVRGKGGPHGKNAKVRVLPMSERDDYKTIGKIIARIQTHLDQGRSL